MINSIGIITNGSQPAVHLKESGDEMIQEKKERGKMKRIVCSLILTAVCLFGSLVFSQEAEPKTERLGNLIQEALEKNPGLKAAELRTMSAEKSISHAGALPDPQITFGLSNLPINHFSFDQDPMTGKVIGIMQMFPFPGKLSLATDIAEAQAAAVQYQQKEIRNHIIRLVKQAYYDLYSIDRALQTNEKNKDLMEQFEHIAETKYATGSGLQHDVLRAQVEISKLEDDLIMWRQKRVSAAARLNALLNRPAGTAVDEIPEELVLPGRPFTPLPQESIQRKRPLLKAWKEKIQKAQAAAKLAERNLWPTFTVGASYRQRADLADGRRMTDFFSATVSLNIPLYFKRKQKAKISEKELTLRAAQAEYKHVEIGIMSELASLAAELERSRKRVELYKGGILLQARQSLESAQAGYMVGKVDFMTLINNWMMLRNYELQYFFALSNFYKSLANYEFTAGENAAQEK